MTTFERIKEISKKRGYSLKQTAKMAGLSENAIYRYNQGIEPKYPTLKAIADVLDVTVDDLLGNDLTSETSGRDLEVEEAINSMRSYQGKPITESQREVLRGIIKGYLDSKDK